MTDDIDSSVESAEPEPRGDEYADLRAVMSSKEGRRFMHRLLHSVCFLRRSPYAQNPTDTAFNAGLQAVGITIAEHIDAACFDLRQTMEQEARFVRDGNVI